MADADDVVWMVYGAWVSMCVRAACELGVVDALNEPRCLAELASRTSSDPTTLARLLRVLVDLGLLDVAGDRFAATSRGEVLRVGHPTDVRSLALMQTVAPKLTAWQHLADAVRRGEAVFESLHGMSSWAWLAANPAEEAVFNAAMARRAALQVAAIRAACDLATTRLVVDVGGGQGAVVAGLLAEEPLLSAVVADRPDVAAAATAALTSAGLGGRARGAPADFFVSVPPGGDLYVLSNVLHDWNDAEAIRILSTVHAAMRPAAHLPSSRTSSMLRTAHPHNNATFILSICTCSSCSAVGSGRRRSMTRSWSQPVSPRPWSNPRRIPGTFSKRSRLR